MELQEFIDNQMKARRADVLAKSDQLTLGEMILKMEAIIEKHGDKDDITVWYDFEYLFPTELNSWRGSYSELALNYTSGDYLNPKNTKEFLALLKRADGATFEGYKGGDFVMNRRTPVWVANYGNSGNTAIIDIIYTGYKVIIMTAYREY